MPVPAYTVEELEDSPQLTWNRQGGPAHTRRFKVPWANLHDFQALITAPGSFPGEPFLQVESVRCTGLNKCPLPRDTSENMDPTTYLNAYQSAIFEVSYKMPNAGQNTQEEEQPDGTRISVSRESTGEFLTIPGRGLYWSSDGKRLPPDAHPVMVISITRWKLRWAGLVRPPWAEIEKLKGRVNRESYTLPQIGLAAPPETLLFEGASSTVDAQFGTTPEMTLDYSFMQKQIYNFVKEEEELEVYGWNHAFNAETSAWDKPITNFGESDTPHLYGTGNMASLFTQGP